VSCAISHCITADISPFLCYQSSCHSWYKFVSCAISHCITADISSCPVPSAIVSQLISVRVQCYQPLCHSWFQSVSCAISHCITADISPFLCYQSSCRSWYKFVSCAISHCITADISPCPLLSAIVSQLISVRVLCYQSSCHNSLHIAVLFISLLTKIFASAL
jgi:hypothetical protein